MTFAFKQTVSLVETEYGWVLLDETGGEFYTLNPTAVTALQTMLDGGDLDQAISQVTDTYDVAAATARADLESLLEDLRAAKLIST